ncbi:diguanylate cyclase [Candidatus Daviesbacteria bacterium]|nr:diguanylate cyclase [Candidatus Daviesbacteria bacterium]MBI4035443.1 diguanylate cyclase [Candidatus Daviesbacteria bacterium]
MLKTPFLERSSQKGSTSGEPFYDPLKSYEENYKDGPFGAFADGVDLRVNETPKINFLGFKINTPFGIPSGPLLNSKFCKAAFEKGFDVIHYKTRRSVAFPTNDWPNVLSVEIDGDLTLERAKKPLVGSTNFDKDPKKLSITNSFGNPSPEPPSIWQEDMKKAAVIAGSGQLLIASVVGTIQKGFSEEDYYEDFAKAAQMAKDTGVKVIEVNLSCPNVASEGIVCYSKNAVLSICKKTKEKLGKTPLLIKLGYFSLDQQDLLEDIIKNVLPYINGISAINTLPAPVVDKEGKQVLPGQGRLIAGICGASIKWAGLDMVKRLKQIREKLGKDFAILGVGGVMTPYDFFEYRNAGADVVQSSTGSMWNPNLAYEIKQKLTG